MSEKYPVEESVLKEGPFDNIALAFSGGGYRAASYSLGVLSYLHKLKQEDGRTLLENVTFISSASGGTIANAMYAQHNANGKSFDDFYRNLFDNLTGTNLLKRVMDILNEDICWEKTPDKNKNMINAFALAYDECLFNGKLLGDLYIPESGTHLEEVCFNTTEFYRGLLFRQNIKMKTDSKPDEKFRYGNFTIHLKDDVKNKLKLSDLLAASSCFPAGLEPIIFPDDFTYKCAENDVPEQKELTSETLLDALFIELREMDEKELSRIYGETSVKEMIKTLPYKPSCDQIEKAFENIQKSGDLKFGFMDGGITDNQALESIMDAQERRISKNTTFRPFNLMLINDVDNHFMDPWEPAISDIKWWGRLSVQWYRLVFAMILSAGIGMLILGFKDFFRNNVCNYLLVMVGTLFSLAGIVVWGCIFWIKKFIKGKSSSKKGLDLANTFSEEIVENLFKRFRSVPLGIILNMLTERVSSTLLLNTDIFLKRIRYLLENAAGNKSYSGCIRHNYIYELSFSNDSEREKNNKEAVIPGRSMKIVAQSAFKMGTTLWFDKNDQDNDTRAAVIACGQFTTCYNLLEFIRKMREVKEGAAVSHYNRLPEDHRKKVDYLEGLLKKDFESFNIEPFWMYNQYGVELQLKDFKRANLCALKQHQEFEKLR